MNFKTLHNFRGKTFNLSLTNVAAIKEAQQFLAT